MTRAEWAVRIWVVLVGAAHEKKTVHYTDLAKLIGFAGPAKWLNGALGCITKHCVNRPKPWPQLTVLVVKKTGKPDDKVWKNADTFDQERENVFGMNWYEMQPPSADDLEKADPPKRRKKAPA
jgi:hypothetical protein